MNIDIEAARDMWRRVILQAVRDALGISSLRGGESKLARREARDWLEHGGEDFVNVCTLAGVNHEKVQRWWRAVSVSEASIRRSAAAIRHGGRNSVERIATTRPEEIVL